MGSVVLDFFWLSKSISQRSNKRTPKRFGWTDLPNFVIVWDIVSFRQANIVLEWFAEHSIILPTSQSSKKVLFSMQVENIWSVAPRSDVSVRCHECCLWGHHRWSLHGRVVPYKETANANLWPDQQDQQDVHHQHGNLWCQILNRRYNLFVFTYLARQTDIPGLTDDKASKHFNDYSTLNDKTTFWWHLSVHCTKN